MSVWWHECDVWVCDLGVMDTPSILSIIRKVVVLTRVRPTLDFTWAEEAVRWKWKSPRSCYTSWTPPTLSLFIVTEKTRDTERKWYGVGVMKDKELKIEDVKDPHTLGWTSYILFEYIDPAEVGADISLAEVGSELVCLLWIEKERAKEKT